MKWLIGIFVVAVGAAAGAAPPPEPAPPTSSGEPEARPPLRRPWQPIELFYRQIDLQRQNVGLNGRKNATRDAVKQAEFPGVRLWEDRPLSDW